MCTHASFTWLLEVQCLPQWFQLSLSPYIFTYWKRSNELCTDLTHSFYPLAFSFSSSPSLSAWLCPVQLRFLRSQDSEGDFILHWAMKALYKYIATASALIAPAILIWLFCCASQHMEERGREKEREKRGEEYMVLERQKGQRRK